MGAKSGFALKFLQWFIRGIQFCCAAIILGIFSYFLATLHNHNLHIATSIRAVEGISGVAVLYTAAALIMLCCVAGIAFFAAVAIILDVAFIGAFIYVAWENRHGASSCKGYVNTPFGRGQSGTEVQGSSGFTNLPSFHTACRLQTACLAVAIIAIFFFIFSILMEVALARHHRKEKRFGPSPANNYTSGYGKGSSTAGSTTGGRTTGGGGFMSRFFPGRRSKKTAYNDNALPEHTHPEQLDHQPMRQSYATDNTAVNDPYHHGAHGNDGVATGVTGGNALNHKYDNAAELPSGQTHGYTTTAPYNTAPATHNYGYGDGVYNRP